MAFDRLLRHLVAPAALRSGPTWVLKGGYALELRLALARSTKDLDLTVRLDPEPSADDRATVVQRWLLTAGRVDAGDFFIYLVGAAILELDGAPERGWRYPAEARLDGRTFAKFHLDVGLGDEILPPIDTITGRDWLGFAGLPPAAVPTLSAEQQWAEKLHACTRPREGRTNSRVKDLVDLLLLIEQGRLSSSRLRTAVAATFARRVTHPVPADLPPPPPEWRTAFTALAAE